MTGQNVHAEATAFEEAVGTTAYVPFTGNQGIDGLLVGTKWNEGTLTYSAPDSASDYESPYGFGTPPTNEPDTFSQISAAQIALLQAVLDADYGSAANDGFSVEGFTNLNFTYAGTGDAHIRVGQSAKPPTAWGYYPGTHVEAGDVWFGTGYRSPVAGNYAWHTMIHELGHTLGLKHGHATDVYGAVPTSMDTLEYTVMTYRSYVGAGTDGYVYDTYGAPQTFMMLDIAALQTMYGADYTTNSGSTVYSWTPGSGATMVNGEVTISPGANTIFATIWDGGGDDTYDLSAYTDALSIDLRPGEESLFSASQRSHLGNGNYASGNIYNAMLFGGDNRSLIENATGGSGNDTIRGNDAGNILRGNAGVDTLYGMAGSDNLFGGTGSNTLDGGADDDMAIFEFARSAASSVSSSTVVYSGATNTLTSIEGKAFLDVNHGGGFNAGAAFYQDVNGDDLVDLTFQNENLEFYLSLGTANGLGTATLALTHGGTPSFIQNQTQFCDVNGDGYADAVFQGLDNRFWANYGSASGYTGASFLTAHGGPFSPAQVQYADVTGDGADDMIFHGIDNRFWLAASNGSGFDGNVLCMIHGGGFNTDLVQYGDVNGDNRADMIYQGLDNRFWISLSTGTGFGSAYLANQHGGSVNPAKVQYADVNADGLDDLIYQGDDNRFWVSTSNGGNFNGPQLWASVTHDDFNTAQASYADVNNDGRADLVYQGDGNEFFVYTSNGATFGSGQQVLDHIGSFTGDSAGICDVNGDGLADIVYQDANNDFYVSLNLSDWFA